MPVMRLHGLVAAVISAAWAACIDDTCLVQTALHEAPAAARRETSVGEGRHKASTRAAGPILRGQPSALSPDGHAETCAPLVNAGTHYTLDVEVGTPPQLFSVVVDTGSDSIIIPSCTCNQYFKCNGRCFDGGENRSTTFYVDLGSDGNPPAKSLYFGSGNIEAIVVSDVVRVGAVEFTMWDSLLLMTDKELNFPGPFEGILGLGIPHVAKDAANGDSMITKKSDSQVSSKDEPIGDVGKEIVASTGEAVGSDNEAGGMIQDKALEEMRMPTDLSALNERSRPALVSTRSSGTFPLEPVGFMQNAGIARFTMCFSDFDGGALRLGTPPVRNALASIGRQHWGLDFRGVSIGDVTADVQICAQNGTLADGQLVQCGAIPDSGTTALMGPKDHIDILLVSICDNWSRCTKNYTKMLEATKEASKVATKDYGINPFKIEPFTKAQVLKMLLSDCSLWLNESSAGLDELPDLYFHVAGADKELPPTSLKLRGRYYIFEDLVEQVENQTGPPDERRDSSQKTGTGKYRRECSPSFGEMDYTTKENGPVWILGLPFFYEYVVGYDLSSSTPSVSFSSVVDTPCKVCESRKKTRKSDLDLTDKSGTALLSDGATASSRQPRRVSGTPRLGVGIDPTRTYM